MCMLVGFQTKKCLEVICDLMTKYNTSLCIQTVLEGNTVHGLYITQCSNSKSTVLKKINPEGKEGCNLVSIKASS